jgi:hypothetical protein
MSALASAEALVGEFTAEPDAEAAQRFLAEVLTTVAGKAHSASAEELATALRRALAYVSVAVHGAELEIQIALKADAMQWTVFTDVATPLLDNVAGRTERQTLV